MKDKLNESDQRILKQETKQILKQAPSCPDFVEGGCIGNHCIRCAIKSIMSVLEVAK